MAQTSPVGHASHVLIGLLLGLASSAWVGRSAHDHTLAGFLPEPWVTACIGLGVIAVGWVMATATPDFAAGLAAGALPGAVYGALVLAGDGSRQLAYGWSGVPIALACLAIGAGTRSARSRTRPWSVRRSTAGGIPRARTR